MKWKSNSYFFHSGISQKTVLSAHLFAGMSENLLSESSWSLSHFNYLHYMQSKAAFWLGVWLFDRVHLYQSIRRMDLYFNEAVREREWSRSQENRPLDLDKSLFCHNTHRCEIVWLSFPVNRVQKNQTRYCFHPCGLPRMKSIQLSSFSLLLSSAGGYQTPGWAPAGSPWPSPWSCAIGSMSTAWLPRTSAGETVGLNVKHHHQHINKHHHQEFLRQSCICSLQVYTHS